MMEHSIHTPGILNNGEYRGPGSKYTGCYFLVILGILPTDVTAHNFVIFAVLNADATMHHHQGATIVALSKTSFLLKLLTLLLIGVPQKIRLWGIGE